MKKVIISLVVVGVIAIGGAGYYFLTNKDEKTSTVASSTAETEKEAKEAEKSVDIESILEAVKAKYNTVTETKVFTEANDPNETLGKPGSYVSGGAFYDTRTEYDIAGDESWGTDAGGSIEVFATEADAIKRAKYFSEFDQSSFLSPGAYKQVGNVVVRASSDYPKSIQDEVIAFLAKQVE